MDENILLSILQCFWLSCNVTQMSASKHIKKENFKGIDHDIDLLYIADLILKL